MKIHEWAVYRSVFLALRGPRLPVLYRRMQTYLYTRESKQASEAARER